MNKKNHDYFELLSCMEDSDISELTRLLRLSKNQVWINDPELFKYACKNNNIDAVKYFLSIGWVIQSMPTECLSVAILHESKKVIEFLIQNGIPLLQKAESTEESPLQEAVKNNDLETIKLLKKHGYQLRSEALNSLKLFSRFRGYPRVSVLKYVIENFNVIVNSFTADHIILDAIENEDNETLIYLIENYQENFNHKNLYLQRVVSYENTFAINLLIKYGAEVKKSCAIEQACTSEHLYLLGKYYDLEEIELLYKKNILILSPEEFQTGMKKLSIYNKMRREFET